MLNTDFIDTHLSEIHRCSPIQALIAIGAGQLGAASVQSLLNNQARDVLLVEADPRHAADLHNQCATAGTGQVHEVAIAPQTGQQEYHIFNFEAFSSLRPAPHLKTIFPGLRELRRETVRTEPMPEILRRCPVAENACNVLLITCLGEDGEILQQLQDADLLRLFSHILLVASDFPDRRDALALLQQNLWDVTVQDSADPDFPIILLRSNPLASELKSLRFENAQQIADSKAAEELNLRKDAELEQVKAEMAKLNLNLQEQRKTRATQNAKNQHLTRKTQSLEQDLDQQKKKYADLEAKLGETTKKSAQQLQATQSLEQDLDQQKKKYADLEAKLGETTKKSAQQLQATQSLEQDLDQQKKKYADLETKLGETTKKSAQQLQATQSLEQDLDQQKKKYADLEAKLGETTTQAAAVAQNLAQLQEQHKAQAQTHAKALSEAITAEQEKQKTALSSAHKQARARAAETQTIQQDLSVALRMQMMREADLKDLQQRYGRLLAQKEQQDDLLQRVSNSLGYLLEDSLTEITPEPAPKAKPKKTASNRKRSMSNE